jgi:hypothetical protein
MPSGALTTTARAMTTRREASSVRFNTPVIPITKEIKALPPIPRSTDLQSQAHQISAARLNVGCRKMVSDLTDVFIAVLSLIAISTADHLPVRPILEVASKVPGKGPDSYQFALNREQRPSSWEKVVS